MYDYQNHKCCGKQEPRRDEQERFDEEKREGEGRETEKRNEDRFDNRKEEKLKNKSSVQVEICGKKHKIESNEVEADKVNLIIKEEQNCECVFAGDEIEYKVKICNDSHVTLRGVDFDDVFNECGRYKKDSFKVNGRKECPHVDDRHIRFRIDEIKPHQEITITFEIYFK